MSGVCVCLWWPYQLSGANLTYMGKYTSPAYLIFLPRTIKVNALAALVYLSRKQRQRTWGPLFDKGAEPPKLRLSIEQNNEEYIKY